MFEKSKTYQCTKPQDIPSTGLVDYKQKVQDKLSNIPNPLSMLANAGNSIKNIGTGITGGIGSKLSSVGKTITNTYHTGKTLAQGANTAQSIMNSPEGQEALSKLANIDFEAMKKALTLSALAATELSEITKHIVSLITKMQDSAKAFPNIFKSLTNAQGPTSAFQALCEILPMQNEVLQTYQSIQPKKISENMQRISNIIHRAMKKLYIEKEYESYIDLEILE